MSDGTEINLERRPDRHGGITHIITKHGTAAGATHPALIAAMTRARIEQESGGHPKATPTDPN